MPNYQFLLLTLVVATSTAPSTVISPAIFLLRGNVVSISSISIFLDKPDDAPEDLSAVHGDEVDKLLNEVLQSLISPRRFNAAAIFVLTKFSQLLLNLNVKQNVSQNQPNFIRKCQGLICVQLKNRIFVQVVDIFLILSF